MGKKKNMKHPLSTNGIMQEIREELGLNKKSNKVKTKIPKVLGRRERRRQLKVEKKLRRIKYAQSLSIDKEVIKTAKESDAMKEKQKKKKALKKKKSNEEKVLEEKKQALLDENKIEDRTISSLEKLVFINAKRKKKNKLPSAFAKDGLDYILDVVDHIGDDGDFIKDEDSDEEMDFDKPNVIDHGHKDASNKKKKDFLWDVDKTNNSREDVNDADSEVDEEEKLSDLSEEDCEMDDQDSLPDRVEEPEKELPSKYIPPAQRGRLTNNDDDKQRRLKRQLKGLLNRLSDANIHSICKEMESVYHMNSRAITTEILTSIILEQFYTADPIPERLITESSMLVTVLYHNVGLEVVAHFLEMAVKKLHQLLQLELYGEGKQCNNVVQLVCSLYQLKSIQKQVVIDLLDIFVESFKERDIELLVLIFKNVGFQLRKDDPISLKGIVEKITSKSFEIETGETSRTKYMLEVLTAIKNNNVRKITGYDAELIINRRKKLKAACQKEADTFPDVTLQDLVNSDNKGRWWIVGSAWSGVPMLKNVKPEENVDADISSKLIDAAQKLRMNTDVRRKIFYAVMSSEDFLEAFEKVSSIGLKGKQLREVGHVVVECCQQQREYNPFYYHLLNKFCHFERQYVMSIQCTFWDRFKLLPTLSEQQKSNICDLMSNLILSEAIPLSCLKTVQYAEIDKATVSFLRDLLLHIADHAKSFEHINTIFEKLNLNKHSMVRQGLKLFLQHFMLKDSAFIEEHMPLKESLSRMDLKLSNAKSNFFI